MTDNVTIYDEPGVRLIVLNRPEKKNALTQAMYAAINDAIAGTDADPALRVTVIAADGPVFTSGNDLADFAALPWDGGKQSPASRFPFVLATAQKPVIAAVNGLAVGVGVTLLAQCDLVYAAETASFRTPFIDLALVPEGASSLLLPAAVGHQRANELLLLGETWTAQEALAAGLVGRLFPADHLRDAVLDRARVIAAKPPGAIRASKGLLATNTSAVLERIGIAEKLFAERLRTPEFAEALAAFMARRSPDFSEFC
jgi:enoyl-CoA hydratase/carnithine racemase